MASISAYILANLSLAPSTVFVSAFSAASSKACFSLVPVTTAVDAAGASVAASAEASAAGASAAGASAAGASALESAV